MDGYDPSSLVFGNGTLYGTTLYSHYIRNVAFVNGTIFSVSLSGQENVLVNFGLDPIAITPDSAIWMNGVLYGASAFGGDSGSGSVFSFTPGVGAANLHSFPPVPSGDGAWDPVLCTSSNGVLYGVLIPDYGFNQGSVFSIDPNGTFADLHDFQGNEGSQPSCVTSLNGALYGTTLRGGQYGGGTAFSLDSSGQLHLLHAFGSGSDGNYPVALVAANGMLYGTTLFGGTHGLGTVYSLSPNGSEAVLHSFAGGQDGATPTGLTAMNGIVYGTTSYGGVHGPTGGAHLCGGGDGNGTVFSVDLKGNEVVVHRFDDGRQPGNLVAVNGVLYGTTLVGGGEGGGQPGCDSGGLVFSLVPWRSPH